MIVESKLTLLSARLLLLRRHANSDESVMWLELLHRSLVLVNQCETCALASTVLSAETKNGNLVLIRLVKFSQLGSEVFLGHIGPLWVEDVAAIVNVSPDYHRDLSSQRQQYRETTRR